MNDMSCDLCRENEHGHIWNLCGNDPDNHGFRISENCLYYHDSELGWEGMQINYCPKCGRKL